MNENPAVYWTNHAQLFRKVDAEQDTDGTQQLVKQLACGLRLRN